MGILEKLCITSFSLPQQAESHVGITAPMVVARFFSELLLSEVIKLNK
jgi:hypothetical protein